MPATLGTSGFLSALCSEAPDRLRLRRGATPQHGDRRAAASLPVLWGGSGGLCCCFTLTHSAHHPFAGLPGFTLLPDLCAVCWVLTFFFLPYPPTPQTSSFFFLLRYRTSILPCPPVTCLLALLSHLSFSDPTFCHVNSTLPPGLGCAVAVHRSVRGRWSQMISGLCSFRRETAWYCCWRDAPSGCLQVQESNLLVLLRHICKRQMGKMTPHLHTPSCAILSLLFLTPL